MLRQAQHERIVSDDLMLSPFVLSVSKDERRIFTRTPDNQGSCNIFYLGNTLSFSGGNRT